MKINQNEIMVPFDILNHLLLILAGIGFVIGGFYMFHAEPTRKYPEWYLKSWGAVTILFFGMCVLILFILILKRCKGLIIKKEGVWDNSSIFSLGLIEWKDVQRIVTSKNNNITQIYIVFKPEREDFYIKKIKNFMIRKLIEFNIKRFGYVINDTMLKIKGDELFKLIRAEFVNYKKRQKDINKFGAVPDKE